MSITYSECVFAALDIQNTMHMYHFHLWPVQLYNIFSHYLINRQDFRKKKVIEHKMCF